MYTNNFTPPSFLRPGRRCRRPCFPLMYISVFCGLFLFWVSFFLFFFFFRSLQRAGGGAGPRGRSSGSAHPERRELLPVAEYLGFFLSSCANPKPPPPPSSPSTPPLLRPSFLQPLLTCEWNLLSHASAPRRASATIRQTLNSGKWSAAALPMAFPR